MQIAQKLAGYTLAEGDVLRRAMGKKIHEEMIAQRDKFVKGAVANGIEEHTAVAIFDKIEKFASYGFNKSHAACYAFISYVTAYLKANYPMEWMAALMTCDGHDTAKVAKFIRECQAMQIAVLPPDVNESGNTFVATSQGIRFAMSAIKGVGQGVVKAVVAEREKNGPYQSLYDFCRRVDIGKKIVEQLIWAGCFDYTGWTRAQCAAALDTTYDAAHGERRDEATGVISLFSLIDGGTEKQFDTPPTVDPVPKNTLLFKERELLGFFLTGHPMDAYRDKLQRLACIPISSAPQETPFRTTFIVEAIKTRIASKSQRKFAILNISDGEESWELPIWSDLFEQFQDLLTENQLLYAVLRKEADRLTCRWLGDLTQVNEAMIEECDRVYDKEKTARRFKREEKPPVEKPKQPIQIKLDADKVRLSHILGLKQLLRTSSGDQPVNIFFESQATRIATLSIDSAWGVTYSEQLKQKLSMLPYVLDIFTSS